MSFAPPLIALKARYVFPAGREPIAGGIVSFFEDRVLSVGPTCDLTPRDLGNVAILPGLTNAHTHTEFSDLTSPLGVAGEPLPSWIARVIKHRPDRDPAAQPFVRAADELVAGGVSLVGEISTAGEGELRWLKTIYFHEVICLDRTKFDEKLLDLQRRLQREYRGPSRGGVSPHAPYTVHRDLLPKLVEFASHWHAPVTMHLAESPEEMELLHSGGGPFRELLESLGAWRDDANPVGLRPLDYLQMLAKAPLAVIAHGNYLEPNEIDFLAERCDRMAVAYCPRTHSYFGHSPYPLGYMLSRGVAMCLGTDSRASNPDLNLFDEMKFCARKHPDVSACEILRMASVNGAMALTGNPREDRADFAVVALPDREASDPYELLFDDEARVVGTWIGGARVV